MMRRRYCPQSPHPEIQSRQLPLSENPTGPPLRYGGFKGSIRIAYAVALLNFNDKRSGLNAK